MSELHRPSIAIVTSGDVAATETLIRSTQNGTAERKLEANVRLVISDRLEDGMFDTVKRLNDEHGLDIRSTLINSLDYPGGEGESGEQTLAESEAITKQLDAEDITLVAMVGYLRKPRGDLRAEYGYDSEKHMSAYQSRLVNSHLGPFVLTKGMFGLEAQERVLKGGHAYSAHALLAVDQTTRLVNDEKILTIRDNVLITEHHVPVAKNDNPQSLLNKVRQLEAKHLPGDLNTYLQFHLGHKGKN